jgi:hypothetical protein
VSEVTEALEALAAGKRSIEDVEAFFAEREWPRRADPPATTLDDIYRREQQDAPEPPEGSFAEVAYAYSAKLIDLDQYARLAKAAAEAMNSQRREADTDNRLNSRWKNNRPF